MQYWIIAFTAALVVVIGYAAGPVGAAISLFAFAGSLYLMWARKLGFAGAWTRFGLDRFTAPFWKGENWDRFNAMFADGESVVKAATIAVALIALSLILPAGQIALVAAAVAAWYAFEVYRSQRPVVRSAVAIEAKPAGDQVIYRASHAEPTKIN